MYMCIYMSVVCMYMYIWIWIQLYTYVCVYAYRTIYTHAYISDYTCMHTYIHMMYVYVWKNNLCAIVYTWMHRRNAYIICAHTDIQIFVSGIPKLLSFAGKEGIFYLSAIACLLQWWVRMGANNKCYHGLLLLGSRAYVVVHMQWASHVFLVNASGHDCVFEHVLHTTWQSIAVNKYLFNSYKPFWAKWFLSKATCLGWLILLIPLQKIILIGSLSTPYLSPLKGGSWGVVWKVMSLCLESWFQILDFKLAICQIILLHFDSVSSSEMLTSLFNKQ